MTVIRTRLGDLDQARNERVQPTGAITATDVQGALKQVDARVTADEGKLAVDVFLVIGDSNAVGQGTSSQSPSVPPGMVLQYAADGTISDANDPTKSAVNVAENANTGSMWPAFGFAYGRRVGFVLTGISGSTQAAAADLHAGDGNWQDTAAGSNYAKSLIAINAALPAYVAAGYNPTFRGIIYVLGSNDAGQINASVITVSQYTAAYTAMAANYRSATIGGKTYPHMPIYMPLIGTSTSASDAGFAQVRSAQLAIAATDGNTLVPFVDMASFLARGLMNSGAHPTQAGYNQMGTQLGGSILPFVQANIPFLPLNANAAAPQLPPAGTVLHLTGADGIGSSALFDGFGAFPFYATRMAGGTDASPSALGSGVIFGGFTAQGRGATGYGTHNNGALLFQTTEAWSDTANGTSAGIFVTPNGTVTPKKAGFFDQDGSLNIGLAGTFTGTMKWSGATSGTVVLQAQAAAGTPTLTLPTSSGTFAVSASSPLVLSATTGALTAPTVVTSGAALTANQLVVGSGGQGSQALGSLGTVNTVLHGNASGLPAYSAVSLTADITGTLPIANGGTGATSVAGIRTALEQGTTLLNVITIANQATVADTASFSAAYDDYLIVLSNIVPVTNATVLEFQVHSGGAFQATSYLNNAGGATTYFDPANAATIGNNAGIGLSAEIWLHNVNSTLVNKLLRALGTLYTGAAIAGVNAGGMWNGGQGAIDGFQLLFSSGNLSTGTIKVYGLRNAL